MPLGHYHTSLPFLTQPLLKIVVLMWYESVRYLAVPLIVVFCRSSWQCFNNGRSCVMANDSMPAKRETGEISLL